MAAPATPAAGGQTPSTPFPRSEVSLRGEQVEKAAYSTVQRVTWADGTVYEETIPTLILRTLGRPDAPHGRRVVARWLEDDRWQVTIFLRTEDWSTDPLEVQGPSHADPRPRLIFCRAAPVARA